MTTIKKAFIQVSDNSYLFVSLNLDTNRFYVYNAEWSGQIYTNKKIIGIDGCYDDYSCTQSITNYIEIYQCCDNCTNGLECEYKDEREYEIAMYRFKNSKERKILKLPNESIWRHYLKLRAY